MSVNKRLILLCVFTIASTLSSINLISVNDGPIQSPISDDNSASSIMTMSYLSDVSLNGIDIGLVIAHGEDNPRNDYLSMVSILAGRGAIFTDISSVITPAVLSAFNILWFDEWGGAMTAAELDAIQAWLFEGGSFLVTGDNFGSVNGLLSRFSVTTVGSNRAGSSTAITQESITEEVSSVYFPSSGRYIDLSSQPDAVSCVKLVETRIASMDYGLGRWVIITDDYVPYYYYYNDNYMLLNNIFGWLAGKASVGSFGSGLSNALVNNTIQVVGISLLWVFIGVIVIVSYNKLSIKSSRKSMPTSTPKKISAPKPKKAPASAAIKTKTPEDLGQIQTLELKITSIQKMVQNLDVQFKSGSIDQDTYLEKKNYLGERLGALKGQLEQLKQ